MWEQRLRNDVERQQAHMQQQQQSSLWSLQQQLNEQAEEVAQRMRAEHNVQLHQLQLELEVCFTQRTQGSGSDCDSAVAPASSRMPHDAVERSFNAGWVYGVVVLVLAIVPSSGVCICSADCFAKLVLLICQ